MQPLTIIQLYFIAGGLDLFFAVFVWIKNPKNPININIGLVSFFSAIFAFGCGGEYLSLYAAPQYINIASKIPWIGVLMIPPYVAFSHYISQNLKYLKIKLVIFYLIAIVIIILTLTTSLIVRTVNDCQSLSYYQASSYYDGLEPGLLAIYARIYLLFGLCLATYNIITALKKATGFRKLQLKYFAVGLFVYAIFGIVASAIIPIIFNSDLFANLPALVSVFWLGCTSFAIIRYHLMDIDTVLHRTVLWVATSLWLMIPAYIFFRVVGPWISSLSARWLSVIALGVFYIFLWYYRSIQPKINHLFRRRKYDYYEVLNGLGAKIGTELELDLIVGRLFKELKEVLYIRNGLVLVKKGDGVSYQEAGRIGYDSPARKEETASQLSIESNLAGWLEQEQKVLEKEQLDIDPQYERIKGGTAAWCQSNRIEVLIPIVLEGKVNGILGLGKKENLQEYTLKDLELLEKLGRQIGITIDNALHHEDIVEKGRLAEEMRLGREIQQNLLPQAIPNVAGLKVAGFMRPAKEIGGDYYDYIVNREAEVQEIRRSGEGQSITGQQPGTNHQKLSIVIGDVSGKGAAAGLIMATVKAILDTLSGEKELSPKKILVRTNSILCRYTQGSKFMTLLLFNWDSLQKSFEYASAGHEHIIICRSAGSSERQPQLESLGGPSASGGFVECVLSGGVPLGIIPEVEEHLEDKQLQLAYGDKVVLFTDGVTEARNEQEELYGLDRFVELVKKHDQKDAAGLLKTLDEELKGFMGQRYQNDDITLVVMEAVRE